MRSSKADWRGMLDELMRDASDQMTVWETDFVESIATARDDVDSREWAPSQAQVAKLQQIWDKVFG